MKKTIDFTTPITTTPNYERKKIMGKIITLDTDPVSVAGLLQKEVCLYSDSQATTPKTTLTIDKILEAIETGGKMSERMKEMFDAINSESDNQQ